MRILVTGATGFVGEALRTALSASRHEVVSVVRSKDVLLDQFGPTILGAMDPDTDWSSGLANVDLVVHLAARVHAMRETKFDSSSEFRRVNLAATQNLARQAANAGVRRFVFVSSVKVNGECTEKGQAFSEDNTPNPQDAYGLSKHLAELGLRALADETGMEVVIIRPPLVYGPGVKANFAALIRAVVRGWPLPLAAVNNQRSLVALDNLVDFLVVTCTHPKAANQTFLVSDGVDLSTPALVRGLALAAGVRPCIFPLPVAVLQAGAALLGKEGVVLRLCENLQVDISKARNLLGWVPPVSVAEGLRRAVEGIEFR